MNTSATTPITPPRSDATFGSNKLGKDEFLKLLMTQLAHQDPSSPADSSAFVAQLAQFASMEQLQSVNDQLEALLVAQTANNQTTIATLVGRDVRYRTDQIALGATGGVTLRGELAGEATKLSAIITDANGKTVRTITLPTGHGAGPVEINWDGRDEAGTQLPPGTYRVKLAASDIDEKPVDVSPRGTGHVTGVSFEKGYPELVVNGLKVTLADVLQIEEP